MYVWHICKWMDGVVGSYHLMFEAFDWFVLSYNVILKTYDWTVYLFNVAGMSSITVSLTKTTKATRYNQRPWVCMCVRECELFDALINNS